jgi:hypothetical protein
LKVIAVHELIHACGQKDKDHATDGGAFCFPLVPDGTGKMIVPRKGKEDRPMPLFRLTTSIVAKVGSLCGS